MAVASAEELELAEEKPNLQAFFIAGRAQQPSLMSHQSRQDTLAQAVFDLMSRGPRDVSREMSRAPCDVTAASAARRASI